MTKYARVNNAICADVVSAPNPLPSWAANDAAWLAIQFPTVSGWVSVPDHVLPGATDNGDGSYTNPTPKPAPSGPIPEATKKQIRLAVVAGLMSANASSNAAARARMRDLRVQVEALTDSTDANRRAKGALEMWKEDEMFSKQEFTVILADIQGGTDMTEGEEAAMLAEYPEY